VRGGKIQNVSGLCCSYVFNASTSVHLKYIKEIYESNQKGGHESVGGESIACNVLCLFVKGTARQYLRVIIFLCSSLLGPLLSIDFLNILPLGQSALVRTEALLCILVNTLIGGGSTGFDHIKNTTLIGR